MGGVGPYGWSLTSGTLPPGLILNADGVISGTPTVVGTSTVGVQATDSSVPTPQSLTETLPIVVGVNGPTAQVAASPNSGIAPFNAGIVVSANQLNSDLLNYTVDFGDGSNPSQGTLAAPYDPVTLSHTYAFAGSFIVSVDVVDTVTGLSSATTTDVDAATPGVQPPTATLDATPSSGVPRSPRRCRSVVLTRGDFHLTYSLDFGDGTAVSSGSLAGIDSIDHTYTYAGKLCGGPPRQQRAT